VRALVTGATGFVGSHLAAGLVASGVEVVALARRADQEAFVAELGARVVRGSLEDDASLRAAAAGVDVVYHVAGLTSGGERELLAANAAGTARLAAAARAAAPGLRRFLYVSSLAAVGPTERGGRLTEASPCRPVTAYGRSKLAGEAAIAAADLPWTITRPAVVYGPRDRELLRLFRIVRLGFAPVFGLGRQELSLVYVDDLVAALRRAAEEPAALRRTYHLAHPDVVTARDLATIIGRAVRGGRAPWVVPVPGAVAAPIVRAIGRAAAAAGRRTVVTADKMAEFLAPGWGTSVELAARDLGWRAAHDLASGVAATAEWYRDEGWLR
jgi:nucleoside-diphosphate-sugar epimerase